MVAKPVGLLEIIPKVPGIVAVAVAIAVAIAGRDVSEPLCALAFLLFDAALKTELPKLLRCRKIEMP